MKNVLIQMIQERRLQMGLNFHDIEQATGIPAKRMYNFEKGNVHLSLDELEQLMQLLGLDQHRVMSAASVPRKKRWKWLPTFMVTLICVALFLGVYLFWMQDSDSVKQEDIHETESNASVAIMGNTESAEEPSAEETKEKEEQNLGVMEVEEKPSTKIRIWGTVNYGTEQLPVLTTADEITLEIFSVEQLDRKEELPNWLKNRDPDHLILNLATRYIFGIDTVKERDQLNKKGIANIGLDYVPEGYNPYILDTDDGRIGVLAFTKHILEYKHIAQEYRVGLARIYESNVLKEAIQNAKQQVDLLIVLIGWGDRDDQLSDNQQQKLAQLMVDAGADVIVGNHPIYAQEIRWLDNTPVFYSLGHLTQASKSRKTGSSSEELVRYGYVIDLAINDGKVSQYTIYPGKWIEEENRLSFDLSDQEKSRFESQIFPAIRNNLQLP